MDINEGAFGYLKLKFPILSDAKIEKSIVIPFINYCSQIHKLTQNLEFENKIISIEKKHGYYIKTSAAIFLDYIEQPRFLPNCRRINLSI